MASNAAGADASDAAVDSLSGGGFVVTKSSDCSDIYLRAFSNTGSFQNQVTVTTQPDFQDKVVVVVKALNDGDYVSAMPTQPRTAFFVG
ncbi:MAG: hypothetical protein R8G34_02580 [Paracoccaceae bacterium]|nr:hypothetical protein [Paracoccaceae bacterium]